MKQHQSETIKDSCLWVQQEWRKLIDEVSNLKRVNLIDGEIAGKLISKLVEFDCAILKNQDLIFKEALAIGSNLSTVVESSSKPQFK